MNNTKCEQYINGQWQKGDGEALKTLSPFDDSITWEGHAASTSQIEAAFKAASKAFETWRKLSLDERIVYLKSFADALNPVQDEFAVLIAQGVGKPLWEAKQEVSRMIAKVTSSIKAYAERTPTRHEAQDAVKITLTHRPHGVFAVLGPFNFPGHLPHGHIVPALLAGNTIVFKSSEFNPAVSVAMLKLWEKAGLPKGVINLVQGKGDVGAQMVAHPKTAGVLFTGSYATGKKIHAQCAGIPHKIVALEMGGNNPLIISPTVDIKAAVYQTILSAFITSGQRCTCTRRLIVINDNFSHQFMQAFIQAVKQLKVGFYNDEPEPFMGPLVHRQARDAVLVYQEHLIGQGAVSLLKATTRYDKGAFVTPGILDVKPLNGFSDDECFGPVLQVMVAQTLDEAITLANNTDYGLSSSIFSNDIKEQEQFFRDSTAGVVNINRPTTGLQGQLPFGGTGHSGNHRPSAYYAADYCAYPVASMNTIKLKADKNKLPGIPL